MLSDRQILRNFWIQIISISALAVPLAMNEKGLPVLMLALVMSALYFLGIATVRPPENSILKAVSYVHYWLIGTLLMRLTGLLVREFLLPDMELWPILLLFYAVCYYNFYKGTECQMRVGEILFFPFLLLVAILTAAVRGEADIGSIRELTWETGIGEWQKGYQLFCGLSAVQAIWYRKGRDSKKKKRIWTIGLTEAVSVIFWGFFTFCIYGKAGHTGLLFPVASAMTLAHFPGNVIGRLDTIFVFVWVTGLFVTCSILFAPLMEEGLGRRQKYMIAAVLAASMALAVQPDMQKLLLYVLYRISMPVQLLLLLLQLGKRHRQQILLTGICIFCILLTGCGHQELEKENLIETICVTEGTEKAYLVQFLFYAQEGETEQYQTEVDSLQEAKECYMAGHEKDLDFNHLKEFYFSEQLMEGEAFGRLLEEIQTDGTYSRGTSVWLHGREIPVHRILNAWYNQDSSWTY